jgi:mono/diheme cytochrome c family protein
MYVASQNQESHNDSMANFTGVVLVLTFVIVMALISVGSRPPTVVTGSENSPEVVEVSTDVPAPTSTSIPTVEPTAIPTLVPTVEPTAIPTLVPTVEPTVEEISAQSASDDSAVTYDADVVVYGETLFLSCSACHGPDAMGVTGLGKNLVESEFTDSLSDDELVAFIKVGRPIWDAANTTGIDMPPKGGNPILNDDDIQAIVAYLRTLSAGAGESVASDESTSDESTSDESTSDDSAVTYDADVVAYGETLFLSCSACHGPDAMGVTGLGKNLVESEFVDSLSDDEFVAFIKVGRPIWDAANTTGIDMPAKGGNPILSDDDIQAIVAYLRTLSAGAGESVAPDESTSDDSAATYDADVVAYGETLFLSCSACHGPDAMGITGLGKNLVESEFVDSLSDDEFVAFIKVGRPIWDAANTTGIDMPAKGGNPILSDDDIQAIVAYLRTLAN